MRIVQLSDIHLAKDNIDDLRNYYLNALISDLHNYHKETSIDVILFTGDLIDKGGESLGESPYQQFCNEVINPIVVSLNLDPNRILFIPGNHDIDRKQVEKYSESGLCTTLDSNLANDLLLEMETNFIPANKRIEQYKIFEKQYHQNNYCYIFSNVASYTIIELENKKIGFSLINDSWRCSGSLSRDQHYVG